MIPIEVLPPEVASKIAAGEVVERPSAVVKELLENSIDAGAKTVTIEIRQGGKRLIRVQDDGSGIPEEEVSLAFARHATSKLRRIEDLEQVRTLGFRGEALASIAAVSRLTLSSRPAGQPSALLLSLEGGRETERKKAGAPAGTSIQVENLFFNVPARLKFLKADATEAGHIQRIVHYYALAYPELRLTFINEGRTALQTTGNGRLDEVLVEVLGEETARQMLALSADEMEIEPAIKVTGYVSHPAIDRARRDEIITFVNRRWVQDRTLAAAIEQAYHTFLMVGRHPLAIVNISLDPAEVDVNVHPTKAEVKFRDSYALFGAVQRKVRAAVMQSSSVPHFGVELPPGAEQAVSSDQTWLRDYPPHISSRMAMDMQRPLPGEDISADNNRLPPLRLVGQVRQAYIIAEGPDGIYLIDQHAAHERILYEDMLAQQATARVVSLPLLKPEIIELNLAQSAILEAERETLLRLGFEIEPFGGSSYRLRAVPYILEQANPAAALQDILSEMAEGAVPLARKQEERIVITVCKRAAIKAGQILSWEEMQALLRQLEQTSAPRTCPHGRPTLLHLTAGQLAREFGRLG